MCGGASLLIPAQDEEIGLCESDPVLEKRKKKEKKKEGKKERKRKRKKKRKS